MAVVVDRVGHQLFTGPAFAPNQNGCIALANLRDHLKNLTHFIAVADNIADTVFVFEHVLQPPVLLAQPLLFQANGFQLDHMAGDHGGNHRQQLLAVFKCVCLLVGTVDRQGADDLLAFFDRNTNKGMLTVLFLFATGGAIQKKRLFADFGNRDRFSGLDDFTGDALAKFVLYAVHGALRKTVGHFNVNLVAQRV